MGHVRRGIEIDIEISLLDGSQMRERKELNLHFSCNLYI